jgi:broad specificity phosphatase PhoE
MATVYLLRHGQASFMQDNYDQLSDLGKKQAVNLGIYFQKSQLELESNLCGELERQKDTFKLFHCNDEVLPIIQPAWNEHQGPEVFKANFTEFIKKQPELAKAYADKGSKDPGLKKELVKVFFQMHLAWVAGQIPTGNYESWESFKMRVDTGIEYLSQHIEGKQKVAIFTSGGVIAYILGKILGISDEKIVELNWQIINTSISELQITKSRMMVKSFNCTPHLSPAEITFV